MIKTLTALLLAIGLAWPAWAAVDLNRATRAELETVKGIGPAKAEAIIRDREKNGPFRNVDDLVRVRGFGKTTVDKLRKELTAGENKTPAAAE